MLKLASDGFLFDRFALDADNRTLRCDGAAVEVSARYLDALILLVSEAGALITKERFLQEVWRGVPVTDEALTQCIRALRRQLGDDATRPRFIETVPKHGYRFVGAVERRSLTTVESGTVSRTRSSVRDAIASGGAGTLGAGVAGIVGGLCYGSLIASRQAAPGIGGVSALLVLIWLTAVAAVVGGAGVSFGIAVSAIAGRRAWCIPGGALGGCLVGGGVKLLGLDAFNMLLGQSPGDITGAAEGLGLGAVVGIGAWLSGRTTPIYRDALVAALVGGAGGVVILLLGGTLMAGSLGSLAGSFPASQLGRMFAAGNLGATAYLATGALEGALFGGCIVAAMALARQSLGTRATRDPK